MKEEKIIQRQQNLTYVDLISEICCINRRLNSSTYNLSVVKCKAQPFRINV